MVSHTGSFPQTLTAAVDMVQPGILHDEHYSGCRLCFGLMVRLSPLLYPPGPRALTTISDYDAVFGPHFIFHSDTKTKSSRKKAPRKSLLTTWYNFGPGGGCRSSVRPWQHLSIPRPRPTLVVACGPNSSSNVCPEVSTPPNHNSALNFSGVVPLLRLLTYPEKASAALADMEALDAAAELQFGDSVERFLHADWESEQHILCAMLPIDTLLSARPMTLSDGFSTRSFSSRQRPSLREVQEPVSKQMTPHHRWQYCLPSWE